MKVVKYFIILFICVCCKNKDNEIEQSKYQILNLIYSDFSKRQMEFFVFPARPLPLPNEVGYRKILNNQKYMDSLHKIIYSNKINKKDSLKRINNYVKNKKNQQIFAFDLKMERYHNLKHRERKKNKTGFENLYQNFVNSEKIDSLNIDKISSKNNDSIIIFSKELLKNKVGVEFGKFNVFVSFSDILFNDDYSKAIIIGTRSFSGTNSHSLIYFLEKQNGKWEKSFEQTP